MDMAENDMVDPEFVDFLKVMLIQGTAFDPTFPTMYLQFYSTWLLFNGCDPSILEHNLTTQMERLQTFPIERQARLYEMIKEWIHLDAIWQWDVMWEMLFEKMEREQQL